MVFTNLMILAMLLLYILIMLPNGIVVLLIGILGPPFHLNVFLPLQELFILMFMMLCNMNFFLPHFYVTLVPDNVHQHFRVAKQQRGKSGNEFTVVVRDKE